jgi:hypothetical protein
MARTLLLTDIMGIVRRETVNGGMSMLVRKLGMLAVTAGLVGMWSTTSRAQEAVPPPAPETAPPSGIVTPVAPSQTHSETVTERGGPSMAELSAGLLTLGVSYGAGAIVAATSSLPADHQMFVPVVGPWMALPNRGGCGGSSGLSCNTQTTYEVLVVADGIGQALGALMIIGAFLHPEQRTVTQSNTTAAETPTVRFLPTSFDGSAYGVQALGTF